MNSLSFEIIVTKLIGASTRIITGGSWLPMDLQIDNTDEKLAN